MVLWYLGKVKRYIQHDLLKISHLVTTNWQHPEHNHNHFEIIFIHRGNGRHYISGTTYGYTAGSVFLLAPCDFHYLEIDEETEITFLKFTNVYLNSIGNVPVSSRWNQHIDELLVHAGRQHLLSITSEKEIQTIDQLFNLIVDEWIGEQNETSEVIFFLIHSLLSVLKRNVLIPAKQLHNKHTKKLTSIVHYIHQHIHTPEFTQIKHLASKFNISGHYLGIYFKEKTDVSLRDYVNKYKLHIIENRLKYSSFSIKEISMELGFTDLSHFNKFFKNHNGRNPSCFREEADKKDSVAT